MRFGMGVLCPFIAVAIIFVGLPRQRANSFQSTSDPIIAAAGDIACGSASTGASCRQMATSDLLIQMNPDTVLLLGDNQYEEGQYGDFLNFYDPSWGRLKSKTRPAVGNHEYLTAGAAGYFDYFNGIGAADGLAGNRDKGYYSFDIGDWHIIALNSNCSQAGGCQAGSPQEQWLRQNQAASSKQCSIAYMHHPLWTSDTRAFDTVAVRPLVQALYDYGAELLLVGHSHFYERFAPQAPDETPDPGRGIRQIIVGTGGRNVYGFGTIEPNSEVRNGSTFGVLRLTLRADRADWTFVPISGQTFTDSGTDYCHGTNIDTTPPSQPTILSAVTIGSNRVDLTWSQSNDNVGVEGYKIFRDGAEIATSPDTSFSDTGVKASTTYSYRVAAYDPSQNVSLLSAPVQVRTSQPNLIFTFAPTDDATILADTPSVNTGAASSLEVDGSPQKDFMLKFSVAGIEGQIVGARLRLYNINESSLGGVFYQTSPSWSEGTVTWSTAPAATTVVGSIGTVSPGNWYTLDLTNIVIGNGVYSLRAKSTSSNGADYSSRQGVSSFTPQLVVEVASVGPTATPSSTASPPATATPVSTSTFTPSPAATLTPLATPTPTPTSPGAPSSPTPTRTVVPAPTPTAISSVITLNPTDDAYIRFDNPGANFGQRTTLQTDNSPVKHFLLRFVVAGTAGRRIQSAKLRLYAVDPSPQGGQFFGLQDMGSAWSESTVNWNNAPAAASTAVASLGAVAVGIWYEVDVTPLVTGDSIVSLRVTSLSNDGADYYSKEGPADLRPQLVVTLQ